MHHIRDILRHVEIVQKANDRFNPQQNTPATPVKVQAVKHTFSQDELDTLLDTDYRQHP